MLPNDFPIVLPVLDRPESGECCIFYTVPVLIITLNVRLELLVGTELA
jgi:hypothetical protein